MGDNTTAAAKADAKALARLNSGVSALALALAANGFKLAEGADPIEAAIMAVKGQAAKIDELEKNASDAAIAAVNRADTAEAALAEATKELEQLHVDVKDLEETVAELEAKAAITPEDFGAIGNKAAPPLERPEGARDFGPSFGRLEAAELAHLVDDGDEFELVFSNGKFEVVELAPLTIEAKDLTLRAGRLHVTREVFARGGDYSVELAGVALVQGGEQVDYCEFPRPLVIEPNQEWRFERAISFG